MGVPEFLPWQQDIARAWLAERNQFAHAWLIHGLAGIGKQQFALAAAAALLCESPQAQMACGQCSACQWFSAGSHPDLRRIRPDAVAALEGDETEEDTVTPRKSLSREIRVEQLRQLHHWFNTATHRGGFRVAVLYPAESLNMISANAMLKVLEEPPQSTVFLLVSDTPDRLLPTLISRCRRLPLSVPCPQAAQQWLQQQGVAAPHNWLAAAGGAPLKALALSAESETACPAWLKSLVTCLAQGNDADSVAVADVLEKQLTSVWVDALQRWWLDLMLVAQGVGPRYYPELETLSRQIALRISTANMAELARWLVQQKAVSTHPLNARLLIQTALQRVVLACRSAS
ncbi:MAG: DNA polymerase III subunit delta' [Pusillimonas sp.]|nr:DNA polymerase III subunit delta' [Pusillimonas sp.]